MGLVLHGEVMLNSLKNIPKKKFVKVISFMLDITLTIN